MRHIDAEKNILIMIMCFIFLTSCMVGPDFYSPPPPPVKKYTEKPLPKKTVASPGIAGNSQVFLTDKDLPFAWWELYQSPELDQLIKAGLAHNQTVAAAIAALKEAQENVNVQIGNSLFPAINTTNYAQRQKYSTAAIGGLGENDRALIFNLFNSSVNVSYTLDVFGGARRQIEALRAQVDYQQFELIAAYTTLTSNIVTTAVSIASYQAQIEATLDLIHIEQRIFKVLTKQYQLGGISKADVLTQETTLEQTKATLPPLQQNLARAKHSMAALIGTFPDRPLPHIKLSRLKLPIQIPVSLPSNLVRQRPDIRASEALLHAASAQIGVATADLFPQFTLTGSYGWLSTSLSQLFTPQSKVWNILGQVAQPLFQGGALLANRRAQIAAYQQADAQYRQTVLQGFQNVADSLRALQNDALTLQAQTRAERAAHLALRLTVTQYKLGGIDYLNLLNAQHQYQNTRINRIQAQAARFADTAALFQALGGGWWRQPWCEIRCVNTATK